MRRRDFLILVGSAATLWPIGGTAEEAPRVIGFLHQGPQAPVPLMNAFSQGLSEMVSSRAAMLGSNTARGTATTIGCLGWPRTS
jgi:hypothetical protein